MFSTRIVKGLTSLHVVALNVAVMLVSIRRTCEVPSGVVVVISNVGVYYCSCFGLSFWRPIYRFLPSRVYRFQYRLTFYGALCRVVSFCATRLVRSPFHYRRVFVHVFVNASSNVFGGHLFYLNPIRNVVSNDLREIYFLYNLFFIFRVFSEAIRTISKSGAYVDRPTLPLFLCRVPYFFNGARRFLGTLLAYRSEDVNGVNGLVNVITWTYGLSRRFKIVLAKFYVGLHSWGRQARGLFPTRATSFSLLVRFPSFPYVGPCQSRVVSFSRYVAIPSFFSSFVVPPDSSSSFFTTAVRRIAAAPVGPPLVGTVAVVAPFLGVA